MLKSNTLNVNGQVLPKTKPKKGFTQIPNQIILDERLSFKARGILALLLSRPQDWKIYLDEIARCSQHDGKRAIQSGFKELVDAGFLELKSIYHPKTGKFSGRGYQLNSAASNYRRPQNSIVQITDDAVLRPSENVVVQKCSRPETRLSGKPTTTFQNSPKTASSVNATTLIQVENNENDQVQRYRQPQNAVVLKQHRPENSPSTKPTTTFQDSPKIASSGNSTTLIQVETNENDQSQSYRQPQNAVVLKQHRPETSPSTKPTTTFQDSPKTASSVNSTTLIQVENNENDQVQRYRQPQNVVVLKQHRSETSPSEKPTTTFQDSPKTASSVNSTTLIQVETTEIDQVQRYRQPQNVVVLKQHRPETRPSEKPTTTFQDGLKTASSGNSTTLMQVENNEIDQVQSNRQPQNAVVLKQHRPETRPSTKPTTTFQDSPKTASSVNSTTLIQVENNENDQVQSYRQPQNVVVLKQHRPETSLSTKPTTTFQDSPKTASSYSNTNSSNTKKTNKKNQQHQIGRPQNDVVGDFENKSIDAFWQKLKQEEKWQSNFEVPFGNGDNFLDAESIHLLLLHFRETSLRTSQTYLNLVAVQKHFCNWFQVNLKKETLPLFLSTQKSSVKKIRKIINSKIVAVDAIIDKFQKRSCANQEEIFQLQSQLQTESVFLKKRQIFLFHPTETDSMQSVLSDIERLNAQILRGEAANKLDWYCQRNSK